MRLVIFICLITATSLISQKLTPTLILEKSIQYHDPEGKLSTGDYIFHFEESRPDGTMNTSTAQLSPSQEKHEINFMRGGDKIIYKIDKDKVEYSVNGKSTIPDSLIKKHRISEERAVMIKNYYLYLWHLPMKLNDPGTILHDEYKYVDFFGHNLLEIKITYEQAVGKDIWYFYFDPVSFKLSGYRFYHDESANDGEYILLKDEIQFENIKLPSERKWYTHKEGKFLGTDNLVNLTLNKK